MQPIVSVITISLNSENTIENTIKSVLNQTYKNIEYIVIDGGSVDNTIRVINKYSHAIAKIISEKDKGIYDAFNKGLNISAGEYIQFVNSDDILDREKIANCVHYMQRNPHTDIINGDLNMINSSGETYEIIKGKKPDFWTKLEMTGMNHPTYFVRTSVYNDHKFNMFRIGMDFDWTLRVIASGHKFGYLASNRVFMKYGGKSANDVFETMKEEYIISIINGMSRPIALAFYYFQIIKKIVFNQMSRFIPIRWLYIFKRNKKHINL